MQKITMKVADETNATLVESVAIYHLSDLEEGVKEVAGDFIQENGGVVIPPVSIQGTKDRSPEAKRTCPQDAHSR